MRADDFKQNGPIFCGTLPSAKTSSLNEHRERNRADVIILPRDRVHLLRSLDGFGYLRLDEIFKVIAMAFRIKGQSTVLKEL